MIDICRYIGDHVSRLVYRVRDHIVVSCRDGVVRRSCCKHVVHVVETFSTSCEAVRVCMCV